MKITPQTVARMAELAKLELTELEQEHTVLALEQVLSHMEVLRTLDTHAVEPMSHVLSVDAPLREDAVGDSLDTDRLLSCAPTGAMGGFYVPRAVE